MSANDQIEAWAQVGWCSAADRCKEGGVCGQRKEAGSGDSSPIALMLAWPESGVVFLHVVVIAFTIVLFPMCCVLLDCVYVAAPMLLHCVRVWMRSPQLLYLNVCVLRAYSAHTTRILRALCAHTPRTLRAHSAHNPRALRAHSAQTPRNPLANSTQTPRKLRPNPARTPRNFRVDPAQTPRICRANSAQMPRALRAHSARVPCALRRVSGILARIPRTLREYSAHTQWLLRTHCDKLRTYCAFSAHVRHPSNVASCLCVDLHWCCILLFVCVVYHQFVILLVIVCDAWWRAVCGCCVMMSHVPRVVMSGTGKLGDSAACVRFFVCFRGSEELYGFVVRSHV